MGADRMGGNERLEALKELQRLKEQEKRTDRLRWRGLWLAAIAAFVVLWALFFRGN